MCIRDSSIIDIDPFTVFGLFNKGITNANRIAILESFATVFNIKSKVPDNFDGIPVLNNLKATYYGSKDDRQAADIDNLWRLYESAINLAEKDDAANREIFTKWYDTCLLYTSLLELKWIRPILSGLETLPADVISSLISDVEKLNTKYATTYKDIETSKISTSRSIIRMIEDLSGSAEDIEGLAEFKKYMEE